MTATTATAADVLRYAIDDAPTIQVTRDDTGLTTVHVVRDDWGTPAWFAATIEEDKAVRLVELLLAAAPHLADLLDHEHECKDTGCPFRECIILRRLRAAIENAGAVL